MKNPPNLMNYVVHIGANKTASTLLQRRLFAKHPALAYIGEDCAGYSGIRLQLEDLIQRDESYYDEPGMRALIERAACEAGRTTKVFSSEDILTARHPSVCAARLGRLMPGATVVLVLRSQLTTWPSWYINHGAYLKGVPKRYWRRHVSFEEWLEYCFAFPDQTPVEAMNYWRHWQIFSKVFGPEKVKVLLYEDLIRDPARYFAQWGGILGIPAEDIASRIEGKRERPRLTQQRHLFDKWSEAVPPLKILGGSWLDHGPAARVEIPPGWAGRIREFYAPGNRAIAEAAGLCLSPYGYPV